MGPHPRLHTPAARHREQAAHRGTRSAIDAKISPGRLPRAAGWKNSPVPAPFDVWHGNPSKGIEPMPIAERRAVAARLLRVVLLPVRTNSKPAGWRVGMPPPPFGQDAVRITNPDGLPIWG